MEFNLLEGYPEPKSVRKVSKNLRTIKQRIVASRRDFDFFDGERNYGYGGFSYDGRWKPIAERILNNYFEKSGGNFLQLNCEKGFLLHDIKELNKNINVYGIETSKYAISKSMSTIKKILFLVRYQTYLLKIVFLILSLLWDQSIHVHLIMQYIY